MVRSGGNRHRSSPRRTVAALATALATVLTAVLTGCSAGPDGAAACPAPSPAPPAETALMPAGLSLDGVGTVTEVVRTDGHVTVRAVTSKPIDEVTVLIQDAVTAAGYRPAGMDNEGFEAEVFFTSGAYAAGQALVRRAECDGRWDVELVLVTPDAIASETATPGTVTPGTVTPGTVTPAAPTT